MKKHLLAWLFLLFSVGSWAQDAELTGSWSGSLDVMGQKLPLVFHFEKLNGGWKGTADSPAQGAKGLALKNILFNGLMAAWEFEQIPALYEGVMVGDTLKGNFTQSGTTFSLELIRVSEASVATDLQRPQEPRPPFDYEEIETSFVNTAGQLKLVGTVTKPKGTGPFPAVVLVSGSGPQNRNGELLDHQPFWVLADHLTKNGIVVFRYDERGVGESEGDFSQATSYDLKGDANDAIAHLRKFPFVDQVKVGAIGHSEGGMIGWMLAAENAIDFLVALAAPVLPIDQFMEQQTKDVLRVSGADEKLFEERLTLNKKVYAAVKNTEKMEDLEGNLKTMIREHLAEVGVDTNDLDKETTAIMNAFAPTVSPWFFEFLKFSAETYIRQIDIPVFAAFGGKDIQTNAPANIEALRKFTADRGHLFNVTTYPSLNHLFQTAETGSVAEYGTITETFNEKVMEDIVKWLKSLM
ncbi:MAG TPA: alpha/beta fold hydrolase [Cyclobacteriaceae bacterium]|nr:alpha/beta fold hydrolase [Cyclobacteriaceae bacterium]